MNNYSNNNYTRISKVTARKAYNNGTIIYIVPCKVACNDSNIWVKPFEMNIKRVTDEYAGYPDLIAQHSFDSRVNNFEFYNCNYELGYYTAFYVKA